MLAEGEIRRVLTEVYVRNDVPDTIELRASALRLVTPPHVVAVDRTAAWLHGVDALEHWELRVLPVLEVFVLRGHKRVMRREATGGERDLAPDDLCEVHGALATTPVRTAVDLACRLSRYQALAAIDALSRLHGLTLMDLQLELRRHRGRRGVVQARSIVPLLDVLAESSGESFIRLAVHDAGLPTPVSQFVVQRGGTVVRLDLAYPAQRVCIEYDGVEFHSSDVQRAHDRARRDWLRSQGWWVIVVTKDQLSDRTRMGWIREVREALASRR